MHYADPCALLRRASKTIGKTKENEGLLCGFGMPPWDVREWIRGDRIPVTVSQKPFKTVEIHAFLAKPATQQIQWGHLLRDLFEFCILFQPTGTWGPAKRACAKPLENQRETQVSPEAPEDPPDVFQITAGFPGTSITLSNSNGFVG